MGTYYVLDTCVLIHDPVSFLQFGKNTVVIPLTVLEELDAKGKESDDTTRRTAQTTAKLLDKLTEKYPEQVGTGIPLENGGTLILESNHISFEKMSKHFDKETKDNKIIAVAKNYDLEHEEDVVLVTNDIKMRVKARSIGVTTEAYNSDRVAADDSELFKGHRRVTVPMDVVNAFYEKEFLPIAVIGFDEDSADFPELNEFITIVNELSDKHTAIGQVVLRNGQVVLNKLALSREDSIFGINALDTNQLIALELLMDPEVKLVSLVGKAGTGKTLLALAAALEQSVEENRYTKIVALRSMVTVGKKEVGFLPGEMESKLLPYMQPFYDNLEFLFNLVGGKNKSSDGKNQMIDDILAGMPIPFEVNSTGFMRGRSLPKQFIIVDEAQNLTRHEIKTLITRAGEGSKIVLLGDPAQIDDPYLDSLNNGLVIAMESMKDSALTGSIVLEGKSKRSALAELASERL